MTKNKIDLDYFENDFQLGGQSSFGFQKIKTKKNTKEKTKEILEENTKNRKNTKNYSSDKDISTKFIIENFSVEIKKDDLKLNDASYFFSILKDKNDLYKYKYEINYLVKETINLLKSEIKEIYRSELMNLMEFINGIKKGIIEKEYYNEFCNIFIEKSKSKLPFYSLDNFLIFIKDNEIDLSKGNFIDFFIEEFLKDNIFVFIIFKDISEHLLKNDKTRNIFIGKFLEKYKLNKNEKSEKSFLKIISFLKDFKNNEIDKKIIKEIQDLILELKDSQREIDVETLSGIIQGFGMMNEEIIRKETINYCFDSILKNKKDVYGLDILRIIIGIQNYKPGFIKDEYWQFIDNKIVENIDNLSIFTTRNILFYTKNLDKNFSKEAEDILFEKIEKTDDYLKNLPENEFKSLFLEDYRSEKIDNLNVIYIILMQIYNLYSREIPEKLETLYENAIKNDESLVIINKFQEKFYHEFKKHYKNIKISQFLYGFEMDIFIQELNLNIEFDGNYHNFGRKILKDKVRDNFLKSKGIEVIRIKNKDIKNKDIFYIFNELNKKKESNL